MTDQNRMSEISTEEASTNFYWTCGNEEVFNLQTTIRGCPIGEQIKSHITTVKTALKAIVDSGGHAKQVGQQPRESAAPQQAQAQSNGSGNSNGFNFKQGKGGTETVTAQLGLSMID
jgi:hypothetical protein